MKILFILVLFFYQVDVAYGELAVLVVEGVIDHSVVENVDPLQEQLKIMQDLHVFSLRIAPRSPLRDVVPSVLSTDSCGLQVELHRQRPDFKFECDALKTLKNETLNLAAN